MITTLEPGLIFVIGLLVLAGNLFALYAIIRLAVTHALDVTRRRGEALASRLGNGIVAVQTGEPEEVVLGMLRGSMKYDHNTPVPNRKDSST